VDSRIQVDGWRKMEAAAQKRDKDGEKWSVACVPPAATRPLNSSLNWEQTSTLTSNAALTTLPA